VDANVIDAAEPTEIEGKTLFNFNFAVGVKYELSPKLATRFEARWRVTDTAITTESGVWCDPWGYCYSYASDWYNSGEFIGGLSYSFR
jgi:opacity protein-like surface antigen